MYEWGLVTTQNIVDALDGNINPVLISTSAVGYYGDRKDDILVENEPPGNDFLATLAVDWEAEALKATDKGVRVAITRFGVIMGKNGGALETMVPLFRRCLGGPLGWGRQWFPWIHLADVINAIHLIVENEELSGPLNFTAPIPIRQRAFARALGRQLKRPAFIPAPSFMIRLIMGELGASLLTSQKVIPDQLIRHGYKFKYMEIEPALVDILSDYS